MLDDIADIRESNDIPQEYFDYVNDSVAFSQTDMLLVQGFSTIIQNVDSTIYFFYFKVLLLLHYSFFQSTLETSLHPNLKFKTFWLYGEHLGWSCRENSSNSLNSGEDTRIWTKMKLFSHWGTFPFHISLPTSKPDVLSVCC